MEFITSIKKEKYDNFLLNSKDPHFLQSYAWGEFSSISKNFKTHYVGLEKNGELIAAALLLQKNLPLGYSYFYCPKGFIIDYSNFEILSIFTKNISEYCKKYKSIFLKIDPEIIISKNNKRDETNNLKIENIKKIGFKHKGYTKDFKRSFQPRYTFQIDLTKTWDDIYNSFSRSTRERIKKANNTELILGNKEDLDMFYELMYMTEKRKGFISYNKDYYNSLYEIYYKNKIKIFLGKFNILDQIKDLEIEKKELEKKLNIIKRNYNHNNREESIIKIKNNINIILEQLKKLQELKVEKGNSMILNAYYVLELKDKCWLMYAGNHDILTEYNSTFKIYSEFLKYFKEQGLKLCDQFGSPSSKEKDNKVYGLYEFKKRFGGDFVEFIGEFDFVFNKPMYFIFDKVVPIYRYIIKKLGVIKKGD